MAHKHKTVRTREVCFRGCVSPGRCRPESHGGVCLVESCACGAERRSNSNAGHVERGAWSLAAAQ